LHSADAAGKPLNAQEAVRNFLEVTNRRSGSSSQPTESQPPSTETPPPLTGSSSGSPGATSLNPAYEGWCAAPTDSRAHTANNHCPRERRSTGRLHSARPVSLVICTEYVFERAH
jgi:hypothetical protein